MFDGLRVTVEDAFARLVGVMDGLPAIVTISAPRVAGSWCTQRSSGSVRAADQLHREISFPRSCSPTSWIGTMWGSSSCATASASPLNRRGSSSPASALALIIFVPPRHD